MSYAASRPPRPQFGLRGMDGANPSPSFRALQGEGSRRGDDPKRTMILTLAALGAGGVALYFFAGDSRIAEGAPQVYTDVAQCVASGLYPGGVCEVQWNEANKLHQIAAPDYASMSACEDKHGAGRCMKPAVPEDPQRSSRYIPVMAGYFFGNTAAGAQRGVPLYNFASEGPKEFHVAELKPKSAEDPVDKASLANRDEKSGSGSRSLIMIPAAIALPGMTPRTPAAGLAPSAPSAPSAASPAGAAAAPGAAARPAAAPAGTAAAPAARGGFGMSAHGGSGSSGG